ncbi:MAG: hypothetical protein JNN18_05015 [Rubrivivax sp.]|nr:hypothetical protein [Rubrivivax sp.]
MSLWAALVGWLPAFVLTEVIEAPIYRLGVRASWAGALLASALTHPLVWFVFPALFEDALGYWPMVALAEVFAVGVEAAWLAHRGARRPLVWSAVANAASVAVGLALRHTVGVP